MSGRGLISNLVARGAFGVSAAALSLVVPGFALAADVAVGGSHQQILVDAQRSLVDGRDAGGDLALGSFQITVGSGASSALATFTPRFGGVGRGVTGSASHTGAPLLQDRLQPVGDRQELMLAPRSASEIAGLGVNWAAKASLASERGGGVNPSSLALGGQLAVSGLHFDASYGPSAGTLVGPEGPGLSAGVGYDFGMVATRMGYSLVERDSPDETSLFTLGSQLAINPGLVLSGDVAYAGDAGDGESSTAGVVSFKFSF